MEEAKREIQGAQRLMSVQTGRAPEGAVAAVLGKREMEGAVGVSVGVAGRGIPLDP